MEEYVMVKDGMRAIEISECKDFIIDFQDGNFITSTDSRINTIVNNMGYMGHSAASIVLTLRKCQYFLLNPEKWDEYQRKHSGSLQ